METTTQATLDPQRTASLSSFKVALVLSITIVVALVGGAHAQGGGPRPAPEVRLLGINPPAEDVRDQFPGAPGGVALFYFKGTKGTTYRATFGLPTNPAIVVGIGADISTTAFDISGRRLTVDFTFNQSVVTSDGKAFPEDVFFLAIDSGAQRVYSPPPPRGPDSLPPGRTGPIASPISSKASVTVEDSIECYGPLGENDDVTKRPGPPLESAGSFMSTNLASWCIVPPNETQPYFGFYLRGPTGTKGYVKKKVAPALVNLISTLSGRSLVDSDFGIYNGDVLASRSISSTEDGGLLISVNVTLKNTSTLLSSNLTSSVVAARSKSAKAASTTTVDKVITASEAESLSIAPNDFSVSGTRAALYGFLTDADDLIGKMVAIKKKQGSKFVTVARAKVKSDGSYSVRVPVSQFSNSGKVSSSATFSRVSLIASIVASQSRTSRLLSIQYLTRNARR